MIRYRTAGLLASTLLLATPPAAAEHAPSGFEHGLRRAIAIAGAPPERLALQERMAHYGVPGLSVAIIEGCKVAETRHFGVAEAGGAAVGPHTLFQAASISKPVTALAALRLVEQGRLSLDGDVRTSLKTWTLPDSPLLKDHPVTLRKLLSHSAGLNVGGFAGYPVGAPLPSAVQILDGIAPANNDPVRVQTAPGTQWRYSGGGYVLTQLLMTETAARPFPALMRELVLDPLGMRDSTYEVPLPRRLQARAAAAHGLDAKPIPGKWHAYPEMGAASLWSTTEDLSKLAIAVMRAYRGSPDAILAPATAAEMLKNQIAHRGLGWIVEGEGRSRRFGHGGTNKGFGAQLIAFPETCQGAVVLANADGGRQLTNEVLRAVADAYRWPDRMPSEAHAGVPLTSAIADRYVGRYRSKERPDKPFDIVRDGAGGLNLVWTRWPAEPLRASPEGLLAIDSGVEFKPAEFKDGRVQALAYGKDNVAERTETQAAPDKR